MLAVDFRDADGALVVTVRHRRLDAEIAPEFRAIVGEAARGRAAVIVSMSRVRHVDASGLAALVCVLKRLAPGGELRVVGAAPPVRALLAATRLDEVFTVEGEASGAVSA
jgi:anti-sigma B factor antagonist